MTRLIPFAFLLTALPWLAGCPACYDAVQYLTVDFEQCQDTCDFAIAGEGAAYVAETIHPGEHALFVDGAIRATIDVDTDIDTQGPEPRVEFVTNCATDAYIDMTLRNADDYALSIILGSGTRQVWAGDYRVVSVPLPNYFDDDGIYELHELRIVGTAGICAIDQISIHTPEEC